MGFYDEARERAGRRRSPWNLILVLLIAGICLLIWFALAVVLEALHEAIYPTQTLATTPRGVGAILAGVAPFFAAIPLAMYVENWLIWSIRPARRILDREASRAPSADFRSAQRQMAQACRYLVLPALGLAILGALLPWRA
jgi:hypothetical protein